MSNEFKQERRYIVVKRKELDDETGEALVEFLQSWEIPTVDCVVVEHDWPIYSDVWAMIEKISMDECTELDELRNNHSEARRICKEICHSLGHNAESPSFCDMQAEVNSLKSEVERLKAGLQFYAKQGHMLGQLSDWKADWDSASGEPENFWFNSEEPQEQPVGVEIGWIAQMVLDGAVMTPDSDETICIMPKDKADE